jgi:hypothetical protein
MKVKTQIRVGGVGPVTVIVTEHATANFSGGPGTAVAVAVGVGVGVVVNVSPVIVKVN